MTSEMLADLIATMPPNVDWRLAIFAQGTRDNAMVRLPEGVAKLTEQRSSIKNLGFAVGMNRAFQAGMEYFQPDHILCLNNDIRMPQKDWLEIMLSQVQDSHIVCPVTNYTSVHEQRAAKAEDRDPVCHGVTPGLCWLIPVGLCEAIQSHLGEGKLFPEDLGGRAWGEDNYTAAVVRTHVNPVPFKIVPRAWIHHLGAKTSCYIPPHEKMACHREAHRRMKAEKLK